MAPPGSFHPALPEIAQAHGFTVEELSANRAGQLHPDQRARLSKMAAGTRRSGIGCLGVGLLLPALGLLIGLVQLAHRDDGFRRGPSLLGWVILAALVGFLPALFGLLFSRDAWSLQKRIDEGRVQTTEGPLTKSLRTYKGSTYRFYVLPGAAARAESAVGWSLLVEGARYRMFVLAGDNNLLSIEPL